MKNPLQTYAPNTVGRDFLIGDLHGSFEVFLNLLGNLGFDPTVDRMFSAGDLVDRGPDSESCLALLKEPWFKCVLANHEQMMVEAFTGGYLGNFWFQNGGYWGAKFIQNWNDYRRTQGNELGKIELESETQEFLELLGLVEELPYLMTIGLTNGNKIHVIHAELPPHWVVTDTMLADPETVRRLATVQTENGDVFAWGRHKFYAFCREDLSNQGKNLRVAAAVARHAPKNEQLSHIVSGHTILQRPMTLLGQTNIDTAAYESFPNAHGSPQRKWAGLTCIELNTWKFYQATPTTFKEVEPLVITYDDIEPFKDKQHG